MEMESRNTLGTVLGNIRKIRADPSDSAAATGAQECFLFSLFLMLVLREDSSLFNGRWAG